MSKKSPRKPPPRQSPFPAATATISPRRLWTMRFLLAVLVPLVLLGGLELGLRLAGAGYPTSYFLPKQINGHRFFVTNEKFGYRFFPPSLARTPLPMRIAAAKPVNESR